MRIGSAFDSHVLTKMNLALEHVCQTALDGEHHTVRKRVAQQIVKCARSGKITLGDLTAAGQRGLLKVARAK